MPTTCRVIIADDQPLVRECVKTMLSRPGTFSVIGEASDGLQLLKLLKEGPPPDVIILDLSMPGLGGLETIREIRRMDLDVRVLVLTMHMEEELLCQAFVGGADGYLLKDDSPTELFTALDTVLKAEAYVSPSASKQVENAWLKAFIASKASPSLETLSAREREVFKLLAKGESNSGIAHTLDITAHAVGDHRAAIMQKLRLEQRADLLK